MRKLIVGEWISIDGFAADSNCKTDFFASPEWSAGSDEDMLRFMDNVDTILLGATTYKQFLTYWPSATNNTEIIADRLNETVKLVFSNSLQSTEWGKWEAPRLVRGDAADEVRRLKREEGKDMILWGSISLFQSLLKAGLIDELHIRSVPVLLGSGRPLFAKGQQARLKTKTVKQYDSGLVLQVFEVSQKG